MLFNVSVVYPTEVRQENLSLQFLVTRQTSARVKAIHNPNKKRKIVSLYNKCRNKSTMIIVEKKRGDGELLDVDKCKWMRYKSLTNVMYLSLHIINGELEQRLSGCANAFSCFCFIFMTILVLFMLFIHHSGVMLV